jgi:hypothetical protein
MGKWAKLEEIKKGEKNIFDFKIVSDRKIVCV